MIQMSYQRLTIFQVVTGVGQVVYDALADTDGGQPQRFCNVVPGEIAWDGCDCGQLAQTITEVWPSDNFPARATDTRQTPCGPNQNVASVTLSLVRCVPVVSDAGKPPSCATLLESARILEVDRWAVREAVSCYLRDLRSQMVITNFAVGSAVSVGPEGGCAGVQLTYLVGVGSLCCG